MHQRHWRTYIQSIQTPKSIYGRISYVIKIHCTGRFTYHYHFEADLPDSYFSPTSSELKSAQTQLSARTRALVNAPLQLRATREAKERSKRDKWPLVRSFCPHHDPPWLTVVQSTIRVRFSDRTQIEKTFPSTNPISFVYAFIRSSLREDVKSVKFTLCWNPLSSSRFVLIITIIRSIPTQT